jgi:hypothetical protein
VEVVTFYFIPYIIYKQLSHFWENLFLLQLSFSIGSPMLASVQNFVYCALKLLELKPPMQNHIYNCTVFYLSLNMIWKITCDMQQWCSWMRTDNILSCTNLLKIDSKMMVLKSSSQSQLSRYSVVYVTF